MWPFKKRQPVPYRHTGDWRRTFKCSNAHYWAHYHPDAGAPVPSTCPTCGCSHIGIVVARMIKEAPDDRNVWHETTYSFEEHPGCTHKESL